MKFRIMLETEFGWGESRSHEICTLERRTLAVDRLFQRIDCVTITVTKKLSLTSAN